MILNYDIFKVLSRVQKQDIDIELINSQGIQRLDCWMALAKELMRVQNSITSRTNFAWIDRTGSIPSVIKTVVDPKHQIPTGQPQSFDFLDICLSRARELLATNKHITVMWSGGLDSTLLLFSLLNQVKNLDQLSVLCTFESVIESGAMFDRYLNNSDIRIKFDQTRQECNLAYSYDDEDPSQLYIHGGCGDQLFGLKRNWWPYADDFEPWHHVRNQKFLDWVEPSLKQSERSIQTIKDLKWWLYFNFAWTTTSYDVCKERPAHVCQRIISFFDSLEFQRWSIHTPTFDEQYDQPRWPEKLALSQLIDYPYYIQNKAKTFSTTWIARSDWLMMDKDFHHYYTY